MVCFDLVMTDHLTVVYIMMRAYRLWDHRQTVRRTLLVVFGIGITAITILSALSVLSYLKTGGKRRLHFRTSLLTFTGS